MNVYCAPQDACPVILDSKCVIYEGENLIYLGINTNDNLRVALQKINTTIQDLVLGASGITELVGDVIAVGPGVTPATLATVNSTPGQFGSSTAIPKLTVDGKGRVTAITTEAVFIPSGALSFIGDVTGTGNTGSDTTLTLATVNSNVYTTNNFLKFSVNGKGLVTAATPVTSSDIISTLGYTPYNSTNPAGYISGITSLDVTNALGYTPYNATNPANYISRLDLSAISPLDYNNSNGQFGIQQATSLQGGYLSNTDWNTFNNKQAAGNYITDLNGEATASGPGVASVTLSNAAVIAKVLTGLNITGGSVVDTDSLLVAIGKIQNQLNALYGGTQYQGVWNANTNTPTLASGVGTKGHYYIVSVPGTTNLDGITDWNLGDWAIYDGTAWQQVDNTDAVVSVNGQTGAVSLTTDNIPEGLTNQYFTTSRTRLALSGGTGISYDNVTGIISSTITQYTDAMARTAISLTTVGSSGAATYDNITGVFNVPQYQAVLTNPVTGTGTSTYIPVFSGTSLIGNSIINQLPPPAIGATFQGGVVAYILQPGDIGYDANFIKGIIISTADAGTAQWGCRGTIFPGAYNSAIGTGQQNTTAILAGCATTGIAARLCDDYSSGGYSDWYLPSINELAKIYENRVAINLTYSSANSGFYWSSTNIVNTPFQEQLAQVYNPTLGTGGAYFKDIVVNVRAIRTFSISLGVIIGGSTSISGSLTLGSTIGNGTYIYTLPSATGTLALTSDIPSLTGYVPYTGATGSVDLGIYDIKTAGTQLKDGQSFTPTLGYTSLSSVSSGVLGILGLTFDNNAGGATLQFARNVFNTYTFPNASGTIALTSNLSAYVPYTGATSNVDLGANSLLAGFIAANGSGGTSGTIALKQNGTLFGGGSGELTIGSATAGELSIFFGNNAYKATFLNTSLTASRTYTLPDASGTLALTSNLSSYVPYTGATTDVNLGTNNLTATSLTSKAIFATNSVGTSGGLISLSIGSTFSSYIGHNTIAAAANGVFVFLSDVSSGTALKDARFNFGSLTNNTTRTYTFQDADGTIALTSDIPSLSGYVPYTGATTNVNLGTNDLTSRYIVAAGSGGLGGVVSIKQDATYLAKGNGYSSIASSDVMFDFFGYTGASTYKNFTLRFDGLTDNTRRQYTLPDSDGTLALTSDLSSYLPLMGGTLDGPLNITVGGLTATSGGLSQPAIVAIGATNGDGMIQLSNSSNYSIAGGTVYGGMEFKVGGSQKLLILNNGNVLIGTATDAGYRLNVEGSQRMNGNLVFNGLSTASGLSFRTDIPDGTNTGIMSADFSGSANDGLRIYAYDGLAINTFGSERMRITSTGTVQPGANGTQDLGTSSLRWATVYTSDLDMSNGVGDYTIVEGREDLFLYNNITKKVFKFALIEVDPSEATPKIKR